MKPFTEQIDEILRLETGADACSASPAALYSAVSRAAMERLRPQWKREPGKKRACYFSAEFLVGRLVHANLFNLGLLDECNQYLQKNGIDAAVFEQIEDDALGNGGLGRLAACFLDSAARRASRSTAMASGIATDCSGSTSKTAFRWRRPTIGCASAIRGACGAMKRAVTFADQTVLAVPYDMPVIGYGGKCVNTLRLWQAEAVHDFDFRAFNDQKYDDAVQEKNKAERITAVLYPNDDTDEGKRLRLKQQYFFSSATMQTLLPDYQARHGEDFSKFSSEYAVQLNDTHPVVAIPELLRLLCGGCGLSFDEAFAIACDTFAYTNHTIMAEALEKWDVSLFRSVLPEVYPYVVMLQNASAPRSRRKRRARRGRRRFIKLSATDAFTWRAWQSMPPIPRTAWRKFTRRSSRTTPCRSGTASIRSASTTRRTASPSAVGWRFATGAVVLLSPPSVSARAG